MKSATGLLLILAFTCFAADRLRLEEPLYVGGGTDDRLQYDDGSAHWLTWGGLYRGVWFDTQDFLPGSQGLDADNTEYWFYHHSTYPWDSADFYAELWNGGPSGPVTMLDRTLLVATHYTANFAYYVPPIATEQNFWALINTEMSAGGWPSILGDNTPNTTDHSFFSDDFIVWEPWIITGSIASDYFIMASGTIGPVSLEFESWGAIKGLHR